MPKDLLSPKTRLELREYFVGTSLARIDDAFRLAGIACDEKHVPSTTGQRRSRVEQFYATLDFTSRADAAKLIVVCEHVLDELERAIRFDEYQREHAKKTLDTLVRCLKRDGYTRVDGRVVFADASAAQDIHDAVASLNAPELTLQLNRLREAVNDDPSLAIGTAKEMLETTCKTILEDLGLPIDRTWDAPALLKETRKHLRLLPQDIPDPARGAATIRRLLSNLGQVGQGLSELRNLYGSGHGRTGRAKGLSPRHARLAVGAVATLVQFLFETHQERQQGAGEEDVG